MYNLSAFPVSRAPFGGISALSVRRQLLLMIAYLNTASVQQYEQQTAIVFEDISESPSLAA
jgi:hypothetical protein